MRLLLIGSDREKVGPLVHQLEQYNYEVDLAFEIFAGKHLFEKFGHKIMVVFHQFPCIDGIELCRTVRARNNSTLLLLLAFPDECNVFEGFSEGADLFLTLPADAREVVLRVNGLARRAGITVRRSSRLKAGDIIVDVERHEVSRLGQSIDVTASEFRLLQFMIQHKNQVVSREEIACGIWGPAKSDKARKLPVHMNNLRSKLMAATEANPGIYTVSRRGYLMIDKEE